MKSALQRLGELLVQKGLLTPDQLTEALHGSSRSLNHMLVSRGWADREHLSRTLAALGPLVFRCYACRIRYTFKNPTPDQSWTCRQCGAALESEDIVPSSGGDRPFAPAPQAPPPDVVQAMADPKRRLGKFVLLRELGRGGMAVVVQAWDEMLQQHVALKLIRRQDAGLADSPEDRRVQEFLREARTAVKLRHPNIVRVFELGHHDDRYFLSMEFIDGPTLAELLTRERKNGRSLPFYADVQKYLGYLRDIGLALEHAHKQSPPIVHRDVKPQNILIDASGQARLVDFGLAKELRRSQDGTLTLSGIAKGTPCYMAPEQALGRGASIDARTDVYGLGAVLYELLAGKPPFTGPTEREILNQIVEQEPVPPSTAVRARGKSAPALPDLERICLRALEKDPQRRYATANEFVCDLDRFLSGEPVSARPGSTIGRLTRWAGRRKAWVAALGAAAVLGAVASAGLFRGGGKKSDERPVAAPARAPAPSDPLKAVDALAEQFQFKQALQACEALLAEGGSPELRELLARRREELQLQVELLQGVATRIRGTLLDFDRFALKGEAPFKTRVLDADEAGMEIRREDRLVRVAWSALEPRQFADLALAAWPDVEGRPALALGLWCVRRGLSEQAARLFSRPGAGADTAEVKRLRESVEPVAAPASDPTLALLESAEKAMASGDTRAARSGYERALALDPQNTRAREGLDVLEAIEKPSPSAAASPPTSTTPEPSPKTEPPAARRPTWAETARPLREYAKARATLATALASRDLAAAAEAWRTARAALGGQAAPFSGDGLESLPPEAVRARLDEVEDWLAKEPSPPDLQLRHVFDLRDLLALRLLHSEIDVAVDEAVRQKLSVKITSLGGTRTGTLERSKAKLFFNEVVSVGGQQATVGWAVSLRGGGPDPRLSAPDLLGILARVRGPAADRRSLLGAALLLSYDSGGATQPLADFAGRIRDEDERRKLRAGDDLRLRAAPPSLAVDLLAPDARPGWSRGQLVQIGDEGLLLKSGLDTLSAFESDWIVAGLRLSLKLKIERITREGEGGVSIGLMAETPNGSWHWREIALVRPGDSGSVFLMDSARPEGSFGIDIPIQEGDTIGLTLVVEPTGLALEAAGKTTSIAGPFEGRRRLVVSATGLDVRFRSLHVTGLPDENAAAGPAPWPEPKTAHDFLTRAYRRRASKEFAGAIEDYSRAAALEPSLAAQARAGTGECRAELGDLEGALADLEVALRSNDETAAALALFVRGGVRMAQKRVDEAVADYAAFVAKQPGSAEGWRRLAFAQRRRRDYAAAADTFRRASEVMPLRGVDIAGSGLVAYDLGQWPRAVDELRKGLNLRTGNDDVYQLYLWLARARAGERAQGTSDLRTYVQGRLPEKPIARWFLKIAAHLLGEVSEADLLVGATSVGDGRPDASHLCEALFYAGSRRLVEGDRSGGMELLQRCVATGSEEDMEHGSARAELDRLENRAQAPPPPSLPPAQPSDPVSAAVNKGVAFLSANKDEWEKPFQTAWADQSWQELVLWTLIEAGTPVDAPETKVLLEKLLQSQLETTKSVALQAVILHRLDPARYRVRIWQCGQFLADNQSLDGSWGYGDPSIFVEDLPAPNERRLVIQKKRDGKSGDIINSYFAAMGMRACADAGIALPRDLIQKAVQWLRTTQEGRPRAPGRQTTPVPRGWSYGLVKGQSPYGSATAAATAALATWIYLLDNDGGKRQSWKRDPDILDGLAWLGSRFSAAYNPGPYEHVTGFEDNSEHHLHFYRFVLQEVATLFGTETLGAHKWREEVESVILASQAKDGSWGSTGPRMLVRPRGMALYTAGELGDTCWSLLFLKKSSRPLAPAPKPKK